MCAAITHLQSLHNHAIQLVWVQGSGSTLMTTGALRRGSRHRLPVSIPLSWRELVRAKAGSAAATVSSCSSLTGCTPASSDALPLFEAAARRQVLITSPRLCVAAHRCLRNTRAFGHGSVFVTSYADTVPFGCTCSTPQVAFNTCIIRDSSFFAVLSSRDGLEMRCMVGLYVHAGIA